MNRRMEWGLLLVVLLCAAALRMTGINWDGYFHYHPDERYIAWVATTIERPTSLQTALNPNQSPFNPYYWPPDAVSEGIVVLQNERRDFAYGHVPLYLGVLATRFMEWLGPIFGPGLPDSWLLTQDLLNQQGAIEFRHLTAVARTLTALFDVGTVFLVYLLGKRVYDGRVGLLAAAFLALNVMHIQLSHFFISDTYLTFFVVAAILSMVACGKFASLQVASGKWQITSGNSLRITDYGLRFTFFVFLAAVFTGLAIGSKFAAVLLLLPLGLTIYMTGGERWGRWLGAAVAISFLIFFITNPFAVLDLSCEVITPAVHIGPVASPALNWRSCYLENIAKQAAMVRGSSDVAFTRQYIGTLPYLYYIEMQLRWGMGWLLGLAAFAGFGWAIWQGFKPIWGWLRKWEIREPVLSLSKDWRLEIGRVLSNLQSPISNLPLYILLAWTLPYFLSTGNFHVKFMRYMQPLVPFLMIYAAALLLSLGWKWVRRGLVTAVLLFTILYALSFVNMYRQPHPWILGSQWIFANTPPGTLILSEQWDDSLPSTMLVNGEPRRRGEYRNEELTWLTGADGADNEAKLDRNLERLAKADYLTIMSNRIYGVTPRLDERYPLSGQYHQLLFAGALGYETVYLTTRMPNLGGISLYADRFDGSGLQPLPAITELLDDRSTLNLGRADESFTVYDQPLLIIFQNSGQLSAAEMKAKFTIAEPPEN
ncbi:MAG: phospholipid carrier-dependent glycosyltransferase [Chloroflexi bacterium]|nr:phospholipid carrier-dependent glycosyltransferase [Chloroflexota bacterium]